MSPRFGDRRLKTIAKGVFLKDFAKEFNVE